MYLCTWSRITVFGRVSVRFYDTFVPRLQKAQRMELEFHRSFETCETKRYFQISTVSVSTLELPKTDQNDQFIIFVRRFTDTVKQCIFKDLNNFS